MHTTATILGIANAQLYAGYGALAVGAAALGGARWASALGSKAGGNDPLPSLPLHDLALLGGGPRLAITSAVVGLCDDGVLVVDAQERALHVAGALDTACDPLQRAVFEAVEREPGIGMQALCATVARGDAVRAANDRLVGVGLLVDPQRARALRHVALGCASLAVLGLAWILAGGFDVGTVVLVVAFAAVAGWLTARRPLATHRGQAIVRRARGEHEELRRQPPSGDVATATALFGAGALWLTAPDLASGLGIPRDDLGSAWRGGGAPGGCGAGGGGGCGAGGHGCGGGGGGCGGGT